MGRSFGLAQAQGDALNSLEILGDILAGLAVAASRAEHKDPIFVDELDGQPIEFGLGDVFDFIYLRELFDAGVELPHFVVGEGVGQAEHGDGVLDGLELRLWGAPTR
jgi:hypothetical protein